MNPNRQVVVQKRGANHTLHIVLTVVTCGLWLPIWALASMAGRKTKTVTYGQTQPPQLPYQSSGYQVQQVPYVPQPGQQPYYPQPQPQQPWPQAWEPQQPEQPYYPPQEPYSQLRQQYPPQPPPQ